MSIPRTVDGLDLLESAYLSLGQLIETLDPSEKQRVRERLAQSQDKRQPQRGPMLRCRNYLRYAVPASLRPDLALSYKISEICNLYQFPKGLAGGGTIGILELGGGFTQSDLDLFAQLNGLPRFLPNAVSVNGGQNNPGTNEDVEVLLDIQVAAAVYFYCTGRVPTINVYFAPNDDDSFAPVIDQAVADGCDVLSISWGKDEDAWNRATADQVEAAAVAATSRGCVIFASSGDNSSGDSAPGANVDLPSACPHIVGCGGTTKTAEAEVVWGDGTPNGRGTGGGYSAHFPPQPFQLGAPVNPYAPGRMVPDVSANADPNTGYRIVVNGQETEIGGTSAVAPLYAGLFAAFGQKLGFVTPILFQHQEAFIDITEGSNGSFSALPGPDPCTGVGVPIGVALATIFANRNR